jgi:Predicted transcriptional regulator
VNARARTARLIRRTIRAALTAGPSLVTAARGAHYRLLVALYRAIDAGATVRIRYVDTTGTVSVRNITPRRLDPTNAGRITCRAYDWRDGEDTTFRTDRMTIDPQEPAMASPNLTPAMKRALARLANDLPINATEQTIAALQQRGLITDNTQPDNGRGWRNLLMLTAAGREPVINGDATLAA